MKIPNVPLETWEQLYSAAAEWRKLKAWTFIEEDALFCIEDPDTGEKGYGCVLGAAGRFSALCIYRGESGLAVYHAIQATSSAPDEIDLTVLQDCLMAGFASADILDEPDRNIPKELGLSFSDSASWPRFRSHRPGTVPWFLAAAEAEFLTLGLQAAIDACGKVRKKELDLESRPGDCWTYTKRSGIQTAAADLFNMAWKPLPRPELPRPALVDVFSAGAADVARGDFPRGGIWQADTFFLSTPVTDEDRPILPRACLVVDSDSFFVLDSKLEKADASPSLLIAQAVAESIRRHKVRPEKLEVRSDGLANALGPFAAALNFKVERQPTLAALDDAREHFQETFEKRLSPDAETGVEPDAGSAPVHRYSDRRITEKALRLYERIMAEKEFETPEEANRFMASFQGKPLEELEKVAPPRDPLDVAQNVIYEAWEEEDRSERIRLARRALDISPDCADAYLLLADDAARNPGERFSLLRDAVSAAERALRPNYRKELEGSFWNEIQTRPFMRAKAEVAHALEQMGKFDDAIRSYQDLLELNPNDNQGLRYVLASLLARQGRHNDLLKLLDDYPDDAAPDFTFTRALALFATGADTASARSALRSAVIGNRFVADYLTGKMKVPYDLPGTLARGGEDEAQIYADAFRSAWNRVSGAVQWLASNRSIGSFKAGRNDSCPCGSGKKFKRCCGA